MVRGKLPLTLQSGKPKLIVGIILITGFFYFFFFAKPKDCFETVKDTVQGESLAPLVHQGDTVIILKGYYLCHPVSRDDFVIYNYAVNSNPIIKMAKGLPGDALALPESDNGRWFIEINGKPLTTSEGTPYKIGPERRAMLDLYINNYKGVIPPDTYLILGNLPYGTTDSTVFGLVGKQDLIGKAKIIEVQPR